MKGMKSLFLLGTALAVMSSSALADTTGTQTFSANISDSTCVINGLNVVKTTTVWKKDIGGTNGGHSLIDPVDMGLSLTGCSSKSVDVQINEQGAKSHGGADIDYLAGFFGRVSVAKGAANDATNSWKPNETVNYAIKNGAVNIPAFFYVVKSGSDSQLLSVVGKPFKFVADVVITEK
ncbi:hypothetical protein N3S24_004685 [Salmonella enterica]|nr:hypothetical protein [Salmonella enterica]